MSRVKSGMSQEEFSEAYDERVEELKKMDKKQLMALVMTTEFEVWMVKDILNDQLDFMEKQTKRERKFAIVMLIFWSIMLILSIIRYFYG